MTRYRFSLLSPRAQLLLVLTEGTYLTQCWKNKSPISFYYLPDEARGSFAEVGFDEQQGDFVVLRSFSTYRLLEAYAEGLPLPAF
jgi:hypothetical protein